MNEWNISLLTLHRSSKKSPQVFQMRVPEFYKLVEKFCYKTVGGMNKIFPVSSILTYNITEWSQFTKGTIYMGKENVQENNIRITSKATYKKVKKLL